LICQQQLFKSLKIKKYQLIAINLQFPIPN